MAVGVSRPSSITQTTSIDSFSMSEVELSTYYDLSAGNYPDQELIVDRPATSSTAKTSSEASQGVSRESNTFAVSSIQAPIQCHTALSIQPLFMRLPRRLIFLLPFILPHPYLHPFPLTLALLLFHLLTYLSHQYPLQYPRRTRLHHRLLL